ncbi:MAG: hypothetical protein LBJ86_05785, partial [Spirochaetaceae bacterium]|nr:hypothetical protein [Spirochaetaceae bacterium]
MDDVLRILTENFIAEGAGRNTRFVFPTQITAFFWARKVLSACGAKTLALEHFLAWDKFKESCIRTEIAGLKPAGAVHRNIFAVNMAERNIKHRLFQTLIPQKYAADGTIFARSIARALPFLRLWRENYERLQKPQPKNPELFENDSAQDGGDRDIVTLENEYKQFLSKHALFESAWERPPFRETENKYFIFYPELIEDFSEHEKLLDSPNIKIIKLDAPVNVKPLYQFDSAREELRAAILEMRRLYEQEKIPYEDMAVSAPDLETLEPYIMRDAAIYDVPLHPRSGKPLAQYGAGRFFSLAKECASGNFSFQALKALLLN